METNKHHLDAAIQQLPQYQPPDGLWDDIDAQLDFDQDLSDTLHRLPTYTPPPALWDQLAGELDQAPELAPSPRRFRMLWWAGSVLLLLLGSVLGYYYLFTPEITPQPRKNPDVPVASAESLRPVADAVEPRTETAQVTEKRSRRTAAVPVADTRVAYRTEVADDVVLKACQSADDPGYALVETLCREAAPVCEEPQFKQLKAELDELSRAHNELKNALGDYADDPDLVAQLVQIEQSRNQILQQLITLM